MTDINDIKERARQGKYRISFTRTVKLRQRQIEIRQLEEALSTGKIVEDYPDDPRGPSCLIRSRKPYFRGTFEPQRETTGVVIGLLGDRQGIEVLRHWPNEGLIYAYRLGRRRDRQFHRRRLPRLRLPMTKKSSSQ